MSAAAIAVRASDPPAYNEDVIRLFVIATMFWGVVGFLAGIFIAFQLAYPGAQSRAWNGPPSAACARCTPRR